MASLIKPGKVEVLSKDGEVKVSLSIDLNLNLNGEISNMHLSADGKSKVLKEEDKVEWAIPDFECGNKLEFGKKEEK